MRTWKNLMFISLMFCLFGCSGDDSVEPNDNGQDPGPGPVAETHTGVFRDSEVAGLYYETETKSGITNSAGEFEYIEGETVAFYVGDIKLGSGPASEDMTPLSIASTENASLDSPEVKNIAALLQTLDSDNDPSNGISIEEATINAISIDAIDFTQPIESILGEIVAEVNLATGAGLQVVYPEEAAVHLAETTGTTYEPGVDVFKTFIPTLESWKIYPSTSVYWIHETNAEGTLVSSIMYEKYPNRILYKIEYVEFMENGLPLKYSQTYYNYGDAGNSVNVTVNYNEDNTVAGFYRTNADGSFNQNLQIELDENLRIIEALFIKENDEFWYREVYHLQNNGNNNKRIIYSSPSGNDESTILQDINYTYTSFGDFESVTIQTADKNYNWTYTYTELNTLKTREREWMNSNNVVRTDKYFYDEEERKERLLIEEGDYITDYTFYSNGKFKRAETYYLDFLYEIIEWAEDGTSVWKTIEEDGSYKLEYKDENEVTLKIEYYDANGNLLSTEE
jgi:hypothetical protein